MDKLDLVLDIIDNPGKYSSEQLDILLADGETRALYEMLVNTSSALYSRDVVDEAFIDRELARLRQDSFYSRRFGRWIGQRVAAIIAVGLSSLVAVAIGVVGLHYVFGHESRNNSVSDVGHRDSKEYVSDTVSSVVAPVDTVVRQILFENVTLEKLLGEIALAHDVDVAYGDSATRQLRLYYRWDKTMSLERVVETLNSFDRINIVFENKTLKVD